jgi:hypothetical protein
MEVSRGQPSSTVCVFIIANVLFACLLAHLFRLSTTVVQTSSCSARHGQPVDSTVFRPAVVL